MKKHSILFVLAGAAITLASCGGGASSSSSSSKTTSSASQSSSTSSATSPSSSSTGSTSSGSSSASNSSSSIAPAVIKVTIAGLDKTYLNEPITLTAEVENSEDTVVIWTVNDDSVAAIADGVLTPLKKGTVTVTATAHADETKKATKTITILGVDVFDLNDGDIAYGEEASMKAGSIVFWGENKTATVTKATLAGRKIEMEFAHPGAWYGAQLFYKALYAASGDTFRFQAEITANVAGDITINDQVVTLEANVATKVAIDRKQGTGSSLSIQLGKNGGEALPAGKIIFDNVKLLDVAPTASYHTVSFVNGESTSSTLVKDGELLAAPENPIAPAGKVFKGWYNGETAFVFSTPITSDLTLTAVFVDEGLITKFDVHFVVDGVENVTAKQSVIEGNVAVDPDLTPKWGHKVLAWYTDEAMTLSYSFDTLIKAETTLYGASVIVPDLTYMATADTGYVIPSSNMSYGTDGEFIVSGINPWSADPWVIQVNFLNPNVGTTGKVEKISFDYKINVAGGDVNLYDGSDRKTNLTVTEEWKTITIAYDGGTIKADAKLSFELGHIAGTTPIDFRIKNLSTAEGDPEPALSVSASSASTKVGGSNITLTATAANFPGTPTYSFVATEGYASIASIAQDDTDLNKFVVSPVGVGEINVSIKATYETTVVTSDPITIKVLSADAPDYDIPTDAFEIKDAATFKEYFNGGAGNNAKNAYLSADIDLGATTITSLGMAGEFSAIFEGQGHKVSNYTASLPFFNLVSASAQVRNLAVECTSFTGSGFGVVSYNNAGLFKNVDVSYTTGAAINNVGACSFFGTGTFEDCDTSITVNTACNTLFAIARADAGSTFTNCTYFVDGTDATASTAVLASASSGVTIRSAK